jgi:hypothetical protein
MKKIVAIAILVVFSGHLTAQDATHEFSVFGSGGLSSLRYNSINGGLGCEFGIGYSYFFQLSHTSITGIVRKHQWGVHTGVGMGFYGTKITVSRNDTRIVTEQLRDSEGDRFEMCTALTGYVEKQRATMLNIPVLGRFDHDPYFFMFGLKFGVPVNGKFSSYCTRLNNEARYTDYGFTLKSQTFAGFGDFDDWTSKGSQNFRVSVALAFESGLKWEIGNNLMFYAGLYFDIGIKNIAGKESFHFISYKSDLPATFSTRSINSVYYEKSRILAAGVKLCLAFGR